MKQPTWQRQWRRLRKMITSIWSTILAGWWSPPSSLGVRRSSEHSETFWQVSATDNQKILADAHNSLKTPIKTCICMYFFVDNLCGLYGQGESNGVWLKILHTGFSANKSFWAAWFVLDHCERVWEYLRAQLGFGGYDCHRDCRPL